MHTFRLKFTINANIVYVLLDMKFGMPIVCCNVVSVLTVGLSLRLLGPDVDLTDHTSNGQRLRSCNDTTYVAKLPTLRSGLD